MKTFLYDNTLIVLQQLTHAKLHKTGDEIDEIRLYVVENPNPILSLEGTSAAKCFTALRAQLEGVGDKLPISK